MHTRLSSSSSPTFFAASNCTVWYLITRQFLIKKKKYKTERVFVCVWVRKILTFLQSKMMTAVQISSAYSYSRHAHWTVDCLFDFTQLCVCWMKERAMYFLELFWTSWQVKFFIWGVRIEVIWIDLIQFRTIWLNIWLTSLVRRRTSKWTAKTDDDLWHHLMSLKNADSSLVWLSYCWTK